MRGTQKRLADEKATREVDVLSNARRDVNRPQVVCVLVAPDWSVAVTVAVYEPGMSYVCISSKGTGVVEGHPGNPVGSDVLGP
jgi:hypothetical protein